MYKGILLILLVGLIGLGLFSMGSYNRLVSLDEGVDTAWSQVETDYQRRADLVPNLVETVKGSADFEQETLTALTEARAGALRSMTGAAPTTGDLEAFEASQAALSGALRNFIFQAEAYADLDSTKGFRELNAQLEGTENRIGVSRKRFNEATGAYNTARRRFPAVLFSSMMGFEEKPRFTSDDGAEDAPSVDFSDDE